MPISLGRNQYGKSECRVVRIYRDSPRHEIRDLNVSTALRGDFAAAHLDGDQRNVLPTDSQKNTAFAFAKQHGVGQIEDYALLLARHFVDDVEPVDGARVDVQEYAWERAAVNGAEHDHTWVRRGQEVRVARPGRGQRRAAAGRAGQRVRRPGPAEVHRLGVRRLPHRRVHDAGRDPRPGDGHLAGRPLAALTDLRRLGHLVRRRAADPGRAVRAGALAGTAADVVAHGTRRARGPPAAHRDQPVGARTSTTSWSTWRRSGWTNPGEVFIAADRPYGLIEATVTRDDT